MPNVHVIAIEIQQFKNGNKVTLVPRIHGNTSKAAGSKRNKRSTIGLDDFLSTFQEKHGEQCKDAASAVIERIKVNGFLPIAEVTENTIIVNVRTTLGGKELIVLRFARDGKIIFKLVALRKQPELLTPDFLNEFESKFNQTEGNYLPKTGISNVPRIKLPELVQSTGTAAKAIELLDMFLRRLRT